MVEPTEDHLLQFQQILDFEFQQPELLRRALTHRSFVNEYEDVQRDNERLEFLGDSILDFIVADMLFRRFPEMTEGELTQLRSAMVKTDSLALLASEVRLGEFLRIGKGEEHNGGRNRPNILCRGFEAIIGAMYMDRGLDTVRTFVEPRLDSLMAYILDNALHRDARSMLQELSQEELNITPVYQLVDTIGPEHDKEFVVQVMVENIVLGNGMGTSKRTAAQDAARDALQRYREVGWPAAALRIAQEQAEAAAQEKAAYYAAKRAEREATRKNDDD